MDRVAVFVDAGYLFASGSLLISRTKLPRGELKLEYAQVVSSLGECARRTSGLPLLRIYWYDGTSTGPPPQHLALAYLPSVKLRLGFVNRQGEQKGVDSLIVADMVELARNRAMADAILVSGDGHIRADSVHELTEADVARFLSRVHQVASPPAGTRGADPEDLRAVGVSIAQELPVEEIRALLATSSPSQVPQEVDRRLPGTGTVWNLTRVAGRSGTRKFR